jgi:hypothetical protein
VNLSMARCVCCRDDVFLFAMLQLSDQWLTQSTLPTSPAANIIRLLPPFRILNCLSLLRLFFPPSLFLFFVPPFPLLSSSLGLLHLTF